MSDTAQLGPGEETDDVVSGPDDDGAVPEPAGSTEPARSDWSGLAQLRRHLAADREPAAAGGDGDGDGDGSPAAGGVVGQPLEHPVDAGRGFSIVHVGLVDDDREWTRSRERLNAEIYTRQVALRYAAAKAKNEPEGGYFALIDPKGRAIGVFTAGSGRVTGPETMKRVKRVLQKNGQTRKRTSRPSKRTSRA